MDASSLTSADENLIETVVETNEDAVDQDFFAGAHIVAAGVRTDDGEVYGGVSLPTAVGRASVCAEPVAIGSAIAAGYAHDEIRTCAAVSYPMPSHDAEDTRVIPPCGSCREMLVDYNDEMRVIVPGEDGNRVVAATDLLPVRTW